MPQFCILFYANSTILATQRGGHGTMPPLNTPLRKIFFHLVYLRSVSVFVFLLLSQSCALSKFFSALLWSVAYNRLRLAAVFGELFCFEQRQTKLVFAIKI